MRYISAVDSLVFLLVYLAVFNAVFAVAYKSLTAHNRHLQRWKRLVLLIPPVAILVMMVDSLMFVLKQFRSYLSD